MEPSRKPKLSVHVYSLQLVYNIYSSMCGAEGGGGGGNQFATDLFKMLCFCICQVPLFSVEFNDSELLKSLPYMVKVTTDGGEGAMCLKFQTNFSGFLKSLSVCLCKLLCLLLYMFLLCHALNLMNISQWFMYMVTNILFSTVLMVRQNRYLDRN